MTSVRCAGHCRAGGTLTLKDGVTRSLLGLVHERCPTLFAPFRPPWWLANGHVQTIYSGFSNITNSNFDQVHYRRVLLRLDDGGTIGLDFSPPDALEMKDDTPIIVISHGLSGGSHESYVRAIVARACVSIEQGGLGFRAVVVTYRGCGGVPITSPRFYNAGETDDFRLAVEYVAEKCPRAVLHGLGFSMGSNLISRCASQDGPRSRLASLCLISCPWDMPATIAGINTSFVQRTIYSRTLGSALQARLRPYAPAFLAHPSHPLARAIPRVLGLHFPTVPEFDATFTVYAPRVPDDVDAYYQWASAAKSLQSVDVPVLVISADDDPVATGWPVFAEMGFDGGDGDTDTDAEGKGNVLLARTRGGGHLAWFERNGRRWMTAPVLEWLQLMGAEVEWGLNSRRRPVNVGPGSVITIEDGMEGMEALDGTVRSCWEVQGGGIFTGTEWPSVSL